MRAVGDHQQGRGAGQQLTGGGFEGGRASELEGEILGHDADGAREHELSQALTPAPRAAIEGNGDAGVPGGHDCGGRGTFVTAIDVEQGGAPHQFVIHFQGGQFRGRGRQEKDVPRSVALPHEDVGVGGFAALMNADA